VRRWRGGGKSSEPVNRKSNIKKKVQVTSRGHCKGKTEREKKRDEQERKRKARIIR